jgi:predicted glycosyltransferase
MAESMGDRLRLLPSGAGVDVYDYIAASDAMICIGSTIAFEAMVLGTMPIVFENPATFNVTSLVEFDAALFVARNTDELRLAIDAVQRDLPAAQVRRGHWPQTIERVLGDLRSPLAAQLRTARECALSGAHGLPA